MWCGVLVQQKRVFPRLCPHNCLPAGEQSSLWHASCALAAAQTCCLGGRPAVTPGHHSGPSCRAQLQRKSTNLGVGRAASTMWLTGAGCGGSHDAGEPRPQAGARRPHGAPPVGSLVQAMSDFHLSCSFAASLPSVQATSLINCRAWQLHNPEKAENRSHSYFGRSSRWERSTTTRCCDAWTRTPRPARHTRLISCASLFLHSHTFSPWLRCCAVCWDGMPASLTQHRIACWYEYCS